MFHFTGFLPQIKEGCNSRIHKYEIFLKLPQYVFNFTGFLSRSRRAARKNIQLPYPQKWNTLVLLPQEFFFRSYRSHVLLYPKPSSTHPAQIHRIDDKPKHQNKVTDENRGKIPLVKVALPKIMHELRKKHATLHEFITHSRWKNATVTEFWSKNIAETERNQLQT